MTIEKNLEIGDAQFEDEMIECVNHIGGVNAFLVFFKFGEKATPQYRKLIKKYANFWGEEKFWHHCMIIVTNCDMDTQERIEEIEDEWEETKSDILNVLNQVSNNRLSEENIDIPFFQFGNKNFETSVKNIFWKTQMDNNYAQKYLYEKEMTPIEIKAAKVLDFYDEYQRLIDELELLLKRVGK